MTDLILVRHGETVGQSAVRLYGATDLALGPVGEQQMARVGAALGHHALARVFTSPLQRARRSAELVLAGNAHAVPVVEVIEDLREVNFGAWEGWTVAEVEARDPENFRRWQTEGTGFTYPGGEARPAFVARIRAAVDRFLATLSREEPASPVLGVLHKGVIKVILAHLTGLPVGEVSSMRLPLGSIHRLQHSHAGWHYLASETAHLGPLDLGD